MKKYIKPNTKTVTTMVNQIICQSDGESLGLYDGVYSDDQLSKDRDDYDFDDEW